MISPEPISASEPISVNKSQSQAIVEVDRSYTGQGQRVSFEMPDPVSTGIVTDTDAPDLDSPGLTDTTREAQILLQLKALTENFGGQTRICSILRWSRMRDGQSISVLECPFDRLGCHIHYSDLADWFWHTLTHFQIAGQLQRTIDPPTSNTCCICEKRFTATTSGIDSWQRLLAHNAYHHLHGHSVATAAAPDVELYTYLWHSGLIDEVLYREIKGMPSQDSVFNPVDKIFSAVDSVSPGAMLSENAMPATVLTERRLNERGALALLRRQ